MDVNPEAEAVQVGGGMLLTVIFKKSRMLKNAVGGQGETARHRITLSVFDD